MALPRPDFKEPPLYQNRMAPGATSSTLRVRATEDGTEMWIKLSCSLRYRAAR